MNKKITAELEAEISYQSLSVVGEIPSWLSGTLVRNGPITVSIDGKTNEHWFDGLAMLHAFSFENGKVHYSNKFLRTDAYKSVFEKGSLNYEGFASDPCRSIFKRFFTLFTAHQKIPNANVNVAKIADEYVALTEIPLPVKFDLKTLDTLGVLDYADDLPHDKCWESAHPHQLKQETVSYLVNFGYKSYYTLYRMSDHSSTRHIISEIEVDEPSYMHSFAVTQNYVILTEFPFVVKPLDLITKGLAFIKNYSWKPEKGTTFTIINRHNGQIKGRFLTKPFFAFHHVNAFEEGEKLKIDIVAYDNADIVMGETFDVDPEHVSKAHYPSRLERFTLDQEIITSEILLDEKVEFPRINSDFDGLTYRYNYLVSFNDKNKLHSIALYKFDTLTKSKLVWAAEGCSPGEPVFVKRLNSTDEDDGVILTVVLDLIHKSSFLLILDGKSFKEIGRAEAPHAIPPDLHGQFFK